MEVFENGSTSEALPDWIRGDRRLFNLLTEIENTSNAFVERAEMIFHKVSELYEAPKYPDDVDDEKLVNGFMAETSVYEQLALLKYLEPGDEKLPENVLAAIYFIVHGTQVEMSFVYDKYSLEGGNLKDISGRGFKNEGSGVELIFVKKDESWYDLGCKYFVKDA